MGIIRGGVVTVFSIIFIIALFIAGISMTINLSLEYDLVKPELQSFTNETFSGFGQVISEIYPDLVNDCENNTDIVLGNDTANITIDCEDVPYGPEVVMEGILSNIIDNFYYADYDCGFFNCVGDNKAAFFSLHAKDYWKSKFYLFLIIAIISSIVLILSTEKYFFGFILTGVFFIVSAIPFKNMGWVATIFGGKWFEGVRNFVNIFFSQAPVVFWWYVVCGFIFILIGIAVLVIARVTGIGVTATQHDVKSMIERAFSGKKKKKGEIEGL